MEKLKNNKFKVGFALVSLAMGAITLNFIFTFFAGYAIGDILFTED